MVIVERKEGENVSCSWGLKGYETVIGIEAGYPQLE